jgi:hypothetical protein
VTVDYDVMITPHATNHSALTERQLRAVDRFNTARRFAERAAHAMQQPTREARMDAARRLEILRREHEAVLAWAEEQLARSGSPLPTMSAQRAVVAHRNLWFVMLIRFAPLACGCATA